MKKILFYFLITLAIIAGAATIFYFWAKSSALSPSEYNQEITYPVKFSKTVDSTLSVMSYNIGYLSGMTNNLAVRPSRDFYKRNEKKALMLLEKTSADLIGFQEIDYNSNRSYHIDQHEYIAKEHYPYTVKAVNWDKRYVPFPYYPLHVHFGKVLSGQSIMSKFPLKQSERIVLDKVSSQPFYYKAIYLDRLLQVVTVSHPIKDFTFMNVHAEAFDQPTRKQQLEFIYNSFKQAAKKGPVILVGDFNSDPGYTNSTIIQFLKDKEIGSAAMSNGSLIDAPKTYPSEKATERLDYVFYTKNDFNLISSEILTNYGTISDHLPCFALLKFK